MNGLINSTGIERSIKETKIPMEAPIADVFIKELV